MRSTLYRILSILLAILSLAGLWLGLRTDGSHSILPDTSAKRSWNSYDDRARGGQSRCEVISERGTFRVAVRKGGSAEAYWGLEWGPGIQGNSPLDLWKWSGSDSLVFLWRARRAKHQRIFLCSRDPHLTTPSAPLSRRYLTADLPIDQEWTRAAIAVSDLEPPAWWLDLHPGLPQPRQAFLESILVLQVGPASGLEGIDDTLEIASIQRQAHSGIPPLLALSVAGLLGALALFIFSGRRSAPMPAPVSAPAIPSLEPRPLAVPPPDLERLHRFLSDNYFRENLDLATVAAELGLSERRVTALFSATGDSFKSILNQLRLQEARRLLLETDLQVSEIAFKVGYGNISHFNRTFRERFQTSPGSLRSALRNPQDPVHNPSSAYNNKDSTDNV
ncbi:MAG: helix-turn-helix domain-containing protein [Fibrobacteres bacterium]|jgi:AraC-like DNA-binding protein|nr:helix-turn-helix domain-containing protein [Fibrobacterota bacterium]